MLFQRSRGEKEKISVADAKFEVTCDVCAKTPSIKNKTKTKTSERRERKRKEVQYNRKIQSQKIG